MANTFITRSVVVAVLAAFVVLLAGSTTGAGAREVFVVRTAGGFGIGYLPLIVMKEQKLLAKHGKAAGLKVSMSYGKYGGGSQMIEAILANNLDVAAGGLGPLAKAWSKTKGRINIKGISGLSKLIYMLNTSKSNIKTLRDFTKEHRIGVPAVKVSIQAVLLQMAAHKEFGQFDKLDGITVSMKHPDAAAAIISGGSEVVAHFGSVPLTYMELEKPGIHTVINSYQILDGPHTTNVAFARESFVKNNPKTYKAFLDALAEAVKWINADKKRAAASYVKWTKSKLGPEFVYKTITTPKGVGFTMTPTKVKNVADFMYQIGSIKHKPASWKDLFFGGIHDLPGG